MLNFRKLAADAQSALASEEAEKSAKSAAELEASQRFVADAVELLNSVVLPILEDARASFQAEGIYSVIKKRYDVVGTKGYVSTGVYSQREPELKFELLSAEPPNAWPSGAAFFRSDGKSISTGSAKNAASRFWDEQISKNEAANASPAIELAITTALQQHSASKSQR